MKVNYKTPNKLFQLSAYAAAEFRRIEAIQTIKNEYANARRLARR